MYVIQRVGRLAGHIVDLPYAEATACLSSGSVELPTDEQVAAYDEGGIEALEALTKPASVTVTENLSEEPEKVEEMPEAPEPQPQAEQATAATPKKRGRKPKRAAG